MSKYRQLPSEADSPLRKGLAGFEAEPSTQHLEKSAAALRRLADVINKAGEEGELKRIDLGHVINTGMLTIALYGFPVLELDGSGQMIDVMAPGMPLRFAVTANQAVSVQLENAISFLSEFVARQEYIARLNKDNNDAAIRRIDLKVAELDGLAQDELVDDLADGWETAARKLARRAADIGLRFEVFYETDLLPDRQQIVARIPVVKQIYNTFSDVRAAIDATVSLVAGREPQIVTRRPGMGSEELRSFLQQQTAASSMNKYLSHAARDGFVCGNGFFFMRNDEPFSFYNLKPDDAVVLGPKRFGVAEPSGIRTVQDTGIQFKGLRQVDSLYGLSILEVFVHDLAQRRLFDDLKTEMEPVLRGSATEDVRRRAHELIEQGSRIETQRSERLTQLLAIPLAEVARPESGIYFAGFELYR